MPIVQERLISLIEISNSMRERLADIKSAHFLDSLFSALQSEKLDLAKEITYDFKLFIDQKAAITEQELDTLLREQAHFKFSRSRNKRNAAIMARVRSRRNGEPDASPAHALDLGPSCPRCGGFKITEDKCEKCGLEEVSKELTTQQEPTTEEIREQSENIAGQPS